MRLDPALINEIIEYAAAKGALADDGNNTEINRRKQDFFEALLTLNDGGKLTVRTLTETIKGLNGNVRGSDRRDLKRYQVFHRGRDRGISTNSQAAQYVKKLYAALGSPLSDNALKMVVSGGLSTLPSFETKVLAGPRVNWKYRPYTQRVRAAFEHDLKDKLDLNADDTAEDSLAHVIPRNVGSLESIAEHAPEYLPELINALVTKENVSPESLAGIAVTTRNEKLKSALLAANPLIALAAVAGNDRIGLRENPNLFFELNSGIQREVHRRLLQDPTKFDLCDEIHEEARNKRDEPGPNRANWIYQKVLADTNDDGAPKAALLVNREAALEKIVLYLMTNPNSYKTDFFQNLATRIRKDGLSVEILQKQLDKAGPALLFQKWSGREKSNAANCLFDLYTLATGEVLTNDEKKTLVGSVYRQKAAFPVINTAPFLERKLREAVNQVDQHPEKAHQSHLGRRIYREIQKLNRYAAVVDRHQTQLRAEGEARYQKAVVDEAWSKATGNRGLYRLDPQGHMLIEVTVQDPRTGAQKTTFCNVDIFPGQKEHFKAYFKDQTGNTSPVNQVTLEAALDVFMAHPSRGSVPALQEDIEMHMRLLSRVVEDLAGTDIPANKWSGIRSHAAQAINEKVREVFQKALVEAYNPISFPPSIDIALLNQKLDDAREELAKFAKGALADAIADDDVGIGEEAFITLYNTKIKAQINKHLFEEKTATADDYLKTDTRAQTVVRITGTENTAHLEQRGAANQPICVIHRNHFNPATEAITPNCDPNIEARTSSIALPNIKHNTAVADVKNKIEAIYTQLSVASEYKGPMVYNALMSFSGKKKEGLFNFFGIDKNKQRERLVRILKGSHIFNKQQVEAGNLDQLCYVQAIPVNQHEQKLSYDSSDAGRREALLMSEMAMLSTLNHYAAHLPYQLRHEVQAQYQSLHRLYKDFLLKNEVGDAYFCESYQGRTAINELIQFKNYGKTVDALGTDDRNDSLEALVAKALLKMMLTRCHDGAASHQKRQFGTLVQTLSVFLEPMSIYGCKSANERFAMVSGRVDLLKSIANKPADDLSPEERAIITELKAFVNDERRSERRPSEKLQTALDKAYNLYNLEGAAAAVSKRDQGGPLKVKASENRDNPGKVKKTEFNGNVAETAHLAYLPKQRGAAPLQAHKKDSNGRNQAQQFVAVVESKFRTKPEERRVEVPAFG